MTATHLFIQPNDVVLFRDGRAFSAGDDHVAHGLFPPNPLPLYGALRSALLSQHGATFSNEDGFGLTSSQVEHLVGTKHTLGALHFAAYGLAQREGTTLRPLLPMPADVLYSKDHSVTTVPLRVLEPTPLPVGARMSLPDGLQPLWTKHSEDAYYQQRSTLLPVQNFLAYLRGYMQGLPCEPATADTYYKTEPRVGLAIDPTTRTSATGNLYTVGFTRLHATVGFAVSTAQALPLQGPHGLLRLGGEARSATYQILDDAPFAALETEKATIQEAIHERRTRGKKPYVRLVLLTPAVFEQGWLPDGFDPQTLERTFGACKVQLIGAAVNGFEHLGGWDLAAGRPKPTRRAVPAGSVYYLHVHEGDIEALFEACFLKSLCTANDDQKQGLGLAVLGAANRS